MWNVTYMIKSISQKNDMSWWCDVAAAVAETWVLEMWTRGGWCGESDGLIEAVLVIVCASISSKDVDNNKPVENCVCLLRNLSYACHEMAPLEHARCRSVKYRCCCCCRCRCDRRRHGTATGSRSYYQYARSYYNTWYIGVECFKRSPEKQKPETNRKYIDI